MFGGGKKWRDRCVSIKPCRECGNEFQPFCGGNLYCDVCKVVARRRRHAATQQAWRKKNPTRHAEQKAEFDLRNYGMTLAQYRQMELHQHGRCAICGTDNPSGNGKTRRFAVDHCHTTGAVRSLLCIKCNTAIGLVGESVETLESMIAYIKKHEISKREGR